MMDDDRDVLNNLPSSAGRGRSESYTSSLNMQEEAMASSSIVETGKNFISRTFFKSFVSKKSLEQKPKAAKELQSFLFSGGILESSERQALLKALGKARDPDKFQDVVNRYEDALVNLRLPVSGDTRNINLEQAMKDMSREVIFVNGKVISFDVDDTSERTSNPDTFDEGTPTARPSKLAEFLQKVPAQQVRSLSISPRSLSISPSCSDGSFHSNNGKETDPQSSHCEETVSQSSSSSYRLQSSSSSNRLTFLKRKAYLWEILEKEIRKFRDGPSSGVMQPLINDNDTQRFTEIVCTAMARTGFGGDSYEAVMALIGANKIIRPIVKPNEGLEPLPAKAPHQTDSGLNGSASLSYSEDSFDPEDPFPIHIEIDARRRCVHVTTTSVFDIHLLDDFTRGASMTASTFQPLGRVCAVVKEIINFDASYTKPIHDRRLSLSLMDSPSSKR